MTAAPFGAAPFPTVDPTAQQSWLVGQAVPVMEFRGLGSATATNDPVHGDVDVTVDVVEPVPAGLFVHAVISTVQATSATTATTCRRAGLGGDVSPGPGRKVEV